MDPVKRAMTSRPSAALPSERASDDPAVATRYRPPLPPKRCRAQIQRVRYLALATDYDGTLAQEGAVRHRTFEALEKLRQSGRRAILVTGREMDDLERVCPRLDLFDRIVAENGALLYRPQTREEVLLAERPPPALVERLRERGVPASAGRVIVALREPHEIEAVKVIRELGLELQVVFNKGAVMLLPSGVNKQTGLSVALAELGLSAHNTVAVGDAENDHAMLAASELGVAVANALDALKERADLVTRGARGEGVEELIARILDDDLRSVMAPRQALLVGLRRDGTEARLAPWGRRVLVAGPPKSGTTTVATALIEQLVAARYQCCILYSEGDYAGLAGVVAVGTSERAPAVHEVLELLANPEVQAAVNLSGVQVANRLSFFASLLPRLQEMGAKVGRPHWIVLDEPGDLLPPQPGSLVLPRDLGSVLLVTAHPAQISPAMGEAVDLVLAVGGAPSETLRAFGKIDAPQLADGEVLSWSNGQIEPVRLAPGKAQHGRQRRKYAKGDLRDDAFVFRGPDGKLSLRAQNLAIFLQMADGVDEATWLHHLRQRDYSRWFRDAVKDDDLAEEAARIESAHTNESRARIREAIERRYALPE